MSPKSQSDWFVSHWMMLNQAEDTPCQNVHYTIAAFLRLRIYRLARQTNEAERPFASRVARFMGEGGNEASLRVRLGRIMKKIEEEIFSLERARLADLRDPDVWEEFRRQCLMDPRKKDSHPLLPEEFTKIDKAKLELCWLEFYLEKVQSPDAPKVESQTSVLWTVKNGQRPGNLSVAYKLWQMTMGDDIDCDGEFIDHGETERMFESLASGKLSQEDLQKMEPYKRITRNASSLYEKTKVHVERKMRRLGSLLPQQEGTSRLTEGQISAISLTIAEALNKAEEIICEKVDFLEMEGKEFDFENFIRLLRLHINAALMDSANGKRPPPIPTVEGGHVF